MAVPPVRDPPLRCSLRRGRATLLARVDRGIRPNPSSCIGELRLFACLRL